MSISKRLLFIAFVFTLLLFIPLVQQGQTTATAESPTATAIFNWSMPDRFGDDKDGDGLIDYFTTFTEEVVVQDWLIISLGDSAASGEGVPDIPIP